LLDDTDRRIPIRIQEAQKHMNPVDPDPDFGSGSTTLPITMLYQTPVKRDCKLCRLLFETNELFFFFINTIVVLCTMYRYFHEFYDFSPWVYYSPFILADFFVSEKSFGTYHAANRRANNFDMPQTFNPIVCRQASAELQAVFEEELSRCSLAAQQELGGNYK
jgi:hypothetical protein